MMMEETLFFLLPCCRGHRLSVESFPGMKVFLELAACVSDVEALLADCVVTVEPDQHGISERINLLSGLNRTWKQRKNVKKCS